MNLLLADKLARCLRDPGNAPRWHRLAQSFLSSGEGDRSEVLAQLASPAACGATADPSANLLRLTFIAGLAQDTSALREAAKLTLEADPIDADRVIAWMSYATLSALRVASNRTAFAEALTVARVPEMAARLARHVAALPGTTPWVPRRGPEQIARVALVIPYAGNAVHTPTGLALNYARACAGLGWSVHVFSCQEMLPDDIALQRGDGGQVALAPLDLQHWAKSLPPGMSLTISDSRLSMEGRWRQVRQDVAKFDPDLVLLAGLYSPLAAALYPLRPTIGVNVHTTRPIAPLDVWLTADGRLDGQRIDSFGGCFAAFEALYHPYRLLVDTSRPPLARREIGVPDEALLAITVGFRLPDEIQGEFAVRMIAMLRANSSLHWLLLGGDGSLPPALEAAPRRQLHTVAARNDVPRLLRSADLFLNPARMGGGYSVAEAMACSLPVLSLAGSDGGEKLGEDASVDLDEYVRRLEHLVADSAARTALGERLRARYVALYDLNSAGPSLRHAAERALTLFRERANGPARPSA